MFGLFSRKNREIKKTAPRFARLGLETLEGRAVPATLTMDVAYGIGKTVTLYGTLSDTANVSMQMISFSGETYGSTTTNAQGEYSFTETASNLGTVTATFESMYMEPPTTAELTLTDVAPVVDDVTAVHYGAHLIHVEIDVSYDRGMQPMTIVLTNNRDSGCYTGTVTETDGHYEYDFFIPSSAPVVGTIVYVDLYSPWETVGLGVAQI